MDITVGKIRIIEKGNLKAFVSIVIDGVMTIHDCRVVQQVGQKAWVSMPQKEYQQNGERKYAAVVEVERNSPTLRRIEQVILEAWETERREQADPAF
jgi:DNA-binding cell septation regulator SpoVG